MNRSPRRVVIIGGGFAGLYAASYLARADLPPDALHVELLSNRNYFTFTPLLAEVVGGVIGREEVAVPLRSFAYRQGFAFRQAEAMGLDLDAGRVLTDQGPVPYDYLILATGAAPRFFGNQDLAHRAMVLTNVRDALMIREQVLRSAEAAAHERNPQRRRQLLSLAVAGGGPAGVEVASEIWLLMQLILRRYYGISESPHITLFEGSDRILNGWDPRLAERGLDILQRRGLDVRLRTRVQSFDGTSVRVREDDGDVEIEASTLIWTAGTGPDAPCLTTSELPRGPSGHVKVDEFLRVPGHENVFAVGDNAHAHDTRAGRPFPPVAPIAISQGIRAAGNVENAVVGRPVEAYQAHHAGKIVSLGAGDALVDVLGWQVSGKIAWATYRLAYLLKLVGAKNKLRAATTLALNHIFERDLACEC